MLRRWVVLDEVDRLLDLGFEQTILEVLSTIRGERLPGLKEKEVTIPCN
jgi:superfamily II DNA/RNA helicase